MLQLIYRVQNGFKGVGGITTALTYIFIHGVGTPPVSMSHKRGLVTVNRVVSPNNNLGLSPSNTIRDRGSCGLASSTRPVGNSLEFLRSH